MNDMTKEPRMQKLTALVLLVLLAACTTPEKKRETYDLIKAELDQAVAESQTRPASPEAVSAALLPPLQIELPKAQAPSEQRFNLAFNNLPAAQFFMVLVQGTRYSMLVPPEVSGTISANLKEVTVFEALDSIREMYGYDYRVDGTRIYIRPPGLQTRVFQVNYLTGNRQGTSDIRVTSGSVSDVPTSGGTALAGGSTDLSGGSNSVSLNSSKISTTSSSDFWGELRASLETIAGAGQEGRSVVVSPQSGVVVVRANWSELRDVDAYLKATHLSVGRQVILEAKILEVQLNDGFQAGINWGGFRTGGNSRASFGMISPNTLLQPFGQISTDRVTSSPGQNLQTGEGMGSLFGLAFQTTRFAALISFLETQGTVHVLSSPRIATLNNQKAVLKVGKDELFVTNLSTTTTAVGNTATTSPNVTLQPFFSGVALDVTPQIDDSGNVILHIHPSVSNVTSEDRVINAGVGGSIILPLASSTISETDSVVRGRDGQIIAIGGLMRQASATDRSQIPGAGNVPVLGALARNTRESTQKRELVILLKPTIVRDDDGWTQDMLDSQRRLRNLDPALLGQQY